MKNVLYVIISVFLFSVFFNGLLNAQNAQKTQTIILKLDKNIKKQESLLLSSENFQPAITVSFLNRKKTDKLLANPRALELLDELKDYYFIRVPEDSLQYKISNIQARTGATIYKSVKFSLDQDKTKTNDPFYSHQWSLPIIEAESAWKYATGKNVVVGVIDTGIDYYHEDLSEQLWINTAEDLNKNGVFDNWAHTEERNGIYGDVDSLDNDGNGYIDDIIGFDFVDKTVMLVGDVKTPDGDPKDEHGHGTFVSSIIASKHNNKLGITGIAFDAKIMTLRAFDASGNNECKDVANAIVYAAMNGADIINMSFGDTISSPLIHSAIKFADAMGCVLIASAGNSGTTEPHYPSDYPEVISVGGCDEKLRRVFNYGDKLDITAPGVNIYAAGLSNTYNKANGTSASAPIVSSVAALLREKNAELTTNDVRTILSESATKLSNGWSQELGAGIVNAYRAVKTSMNYQKTNVTIDYPADNTTINIYQNDTIKIIGSTITPLFDSYLIRIRKTNSVRYNSLDEANWDTLVPPQYISKNNEELGKFCVNSLKLKDSLENYTLSLLITSKNRNILETRNRIKFYTEKTNFRINKLAVYQPFYYNRRINLVNVQTNSPCRLEIYYREKNTSTEYKLFVSDNSYTKNHIVILPETNPNKEIEAYALAILAGSNTTVKQNFTFKYTDEAFENYSFIKKSYELPKSYIYNNSLDIFNSNSKQFVMNNLDYNSNLINSKIYQYNSDENNFKVVDSTNNLYVTVADGDSNGDEKQEILAGAYAQYHLFQSKYAANSNSLRDSSNTIFDNIIFSFPEGYWAEAMIDINGDSKKEIILSSDINSDFLIYSYENNNYVLKTKKNINEFTSEILEKTQQDITNYELQKGFAVGDFDGDGNIEIALTTKYNDYLLIIEIDKNFNTKLKDYLKLENYHHNAQSHYMTSCDLDADGKQDIVYLYFGKLDDGEGTLAENEMWTYSVFKYSKNNEFEKVFEDDIYGVRTWGYKFPFYFRNGITAGEINNIPGDEVVISTFPNLYVLSWDTSACALVPMWNYPYSLTNKAIISDVDNNGKIEIGFASFSNTVFYEYNPDYKIGTEITNFTGYANSKTSAIFSWAPSQKEEKDSNNNSNSINYELWLIKTKDISNADSRFNIFSTKNTSIEISDLEENTKYTAYIKLANNEEYFSEPVEIFTSDIIEATNVEYQEYNNLLKVKFSGLLPYNIPAGCFTYKTIIDDDSSKNIFTPVSGISILGDSSVILNLGEKKPQNGKYKLYVSSFKDFYGNFSAPSLLDFTVDIISTNYMFLNKLDFIKPNKILLQFSEPANNATTVNKFNYKISPFGEIENIIQIMPDMLEIYLNPNMLDARGKDFLITASTNIISDAGSSMTAGLGNTLGFTIYENNLSNIYIYPNPIKLSKTDEAYIGRLTKQAKIEIMTLDGKILRSIEEFDANGGVAWNLRDDTGNILSPGVYLVKVTDKSGSEEVSINKFAIIE